MELNKIKWNDKVGMGVSLPLRSTASARSFVRSLRSALRMEE